MSKQSEKQEAVAGVGILVAAFTNEDAGEEAVSVLAGELVLVRAEPAVLEVDEEPVGVLQVREVEIGHVALGIHVLEDISTAHARGRDRHRIGRPVQHIPGMARLLQHPVAAVLPAAQPYAGTFVGAPDRPPVVVPCGALAY